MQVILNVFLGWKIIKNLDISSSIGYDMKLNQRIANYAQKFELKNNSRWIFFLIISNDKFRRFKKNSNKYELYFLFLSDKVKLFSFT